MSVSGFAMPGLRIVTFAFLVLSVLLLMPTQKAYSVPDEEMRTVFMIADLKDSEIGDIPINAYIIYGDQLILADTFYVPTRLGGGVGLAVDHENELLFLSFEYGWQTGDTDDLAEDNENDADTGEYYTDSFEVSLEEPKAGPSDTIDVFDARTGTFLNSIYLAGTSDLCGMVVHQDRGHLYVVDRGQKDIFVFDTNNNFAAVEHWVLPTGSGAWGIDLVGDTLYTTDADPLFTHYVRWYDIDTHQEIGSYNFPGENTGIVVVEEASGPVIYTTQYDGTLNGETIQRYEVNTGNYSTFELGYHSVGISANPPHDLIYAAHSNGFFGGPNHLKVFQGSTGTLLHDYTGVNGRPTDVIASAIPFGGTVSKTCTSHPNGDIQQGDNAVFEITIENKGSLPLVFIPLNDIYDDTHFNFVSASPSPSNPTNGDLNWNDLTISLGDLPAGQSMTITVTLEATDDCVEDLAGSNLANVEAALDSVGNEMWAAGVFDYTIACGCTVNGDCDDGEWCNGAEWCDGNGDCQDGSEQCQDDGLWCNGEESCNEVLNQCITTTPPCNDDGVYCNGEETCIEANDTCGHAGDPCTDDSLWCNGTESCNETADQCDHSGNPCPSDGIFCDGDEMCNEDTDACEYVENPCPDDGLWCTGEEGCDEEADQCITTGNPCGDDGVFCNGAESCDEEGKACVSAGDPCGSDDLFCNGEESCNEQEQACDSTGNPCDVDEVCDEELDLCKGADVDDDDTPGEEDEGEEEVWPEGKVSGGCCGCE